MHVQIAEVEVGYSAAADVAGSAARRLSANHPHDQESPLLAARGIVTALLIAAPFWALFAFTLYLLI